MTTMMTVDPVAVLPPGLSEERSHLERESRRLVEIADAAEARYAKSSVGAAAYQTGGTAISVDASNARNAAWTAVIPVLSDLHLCEKLLANGADPTRPRVIEYARLVNEGRVRSEMLEKRRAELAGQTASLNAAVVEESASNVNLILAGKPTGPRRSREALDRNRQDIEDLDGAIRAADAAWQATSRWKSECLNQAREDVSQMRQNWERRASEAARKAIVPFTKESPRLNRRPSRRA